MKVTGTVLCWEHRAFSVIRVIAIVCGGICTGHGGPVPNIPIPFYTGSTKTDHRPCGCVAQCRQSAEEALSGIIYLS